MCNKHTGNINKKILEWSAVSKSEGDIISIKHYDYTPTTHTVKKSTLRLNKNKSVNEKRQMIKFSDNPMQRDQNKTTIELVVAGNMSKTFLPIKYFLFGIRSLHKRFCHFHVQLVDGKKNCEFDPLIMRKSVPQELNQSQTQIIFDNFDKYGVDLDGILNKEENDPIMGIYNLKKSQIFGWREKIFCHASIQKIETWTEKEVWDVLKPIHATEPTSLIQLQFIKNGKLIFPISERDAILRIFETKIKWSEYGVHFFRDSSWSLTVNDSCYVQKKAKMRCRKSLQWILRVFLILKDESVDGEHYDLSVENGIIEVVHKAIDKVKRMCPELMYNYKEMKLERMMLEGIPNIAEALANVLNMSEKLQPMRIALTDGVNDQDQVQHKLYEMMIESVNNDKCRMQEKISKLYRSEDTYKNDEDENKMEQMPVSQNESEEEQVDDSMDYDDDETVIEYDDENGMNVEDDNDECSQQYDDDALMSQIEQTLNDFH